jgi:hypothetical protein
LKCVVPKGGSLLATRGGLTSFGPPSGETGLAQRHRTSRKNNEKRIKHSVLFTLTGFDFRNCPRQIYQGFLYK